MKKTNSNPPEKLASFNRIEANRPFEAKTLWIFLMAQWANDRNGQAG